MSNLKDLLEFRRAIRYYTDEPLDTEKVRACIELAQLTPTSSNMQMYEAYHITDPELKKVIALACLGQSSAMTAEQFVIYVTRQDLYKEHAKVLLQAEIENIKRNSPQERWESRIKQKEGYYGKAIPVLYARFFGLLGLVRKIVTWGVGLFRPTVREVSESDVHASVHQSCGMVAQTFIMAMTEQGYDTCPLGGFDSKRIKKALGLPCGAEVAMVISCGRRDLKGVHGDRIRLPFEQIYRRR